MSIGHTPRRQHALVALLGHAVVIGVALALQEGARPGAEPPAGAGDEPILRQRFAGGPGPEWSTSIDQCPDGGVAISSLTAHDASSQQGWVIRYDAEGELLWERKYGGDGTEWAEFLQALPDGGVAVVGATNSEGAGSFDGWVLRLGRNGDVVWRRTFGGRGFDRLDAIAALPDGGFVASGDATPEGRTSFDAWVVRLDAGGNMRWERHYGGPDRDEGRFIAALPSGGFGVAGLTTSKGAGSEDAWIIRLNDDGRVLWDTTVGGAGLERALELREVADGGIVGVGISRSPPDGPSDALVFKLDADGKLLWERTLGGEGEDNFWGLWPLDDGGVVAAGSLTPEGGGPPDAWLVQLDAGGEVVWSGTYGGEGFNVLSGVQARRAGGLVAGGQAREPGSEVGDVWVVWLEEWGARTPPSPESRSGPDR